MGCATSVDPNLGRLQLGGDEESRLGEAKGVEDILVGNIDNSEKRIGDAEAEGEVEGGDIGVVGEGGGEVLGMEEAKGLMVAGQRLGRNSRQGRRTCGRRWPPATNGHLPFDVQIFFLLQKLFVNVNFSKHYFA